MRCDVVAVGTELLLGQIVDTNSAWIGEQLALAGIDSHFHTAVGDNHARIVSALQIALGRSDAVIVCGGLGPTHDDITREAIAAVMGVSLDLDAEVAERIRAMFAARRRPMPDSNLRQAMVPAGATAIADPQPGTAPGLICPVGEQVIYAVPGVPAEMRALVAAVVLPDLRRRLIGFGQGEAAIVSRVVRVWGEGESMVAERLAGRIAALDEAGNPTLAFLASGAEGLKVRLTAKAADVGAAKAMADAEADTVRAILGDLVFGVDDDTMESVVIDLLDRQGLTLGLAESLTGGLVGARLTAVTGVSSVFRGSIVSYDSEVKFDLLDVPEGPVVSDVAARAMAVGVRRVLDADIGLAVTGVAGPAEQDGRPPGTVFIGLARGKVGASPDTVEAVEVQLPGGRQQVRELSVISALDLLRRRLS